MPTWNSLSVPFAAATAFCIWYLLFKKKKEKLQSSSKICVSEAEERDTEVTEEIVFKTHSTQLNSVSPFKESQINNFVLHSAIEDTLEDICDSSKLQYICYVENMSVSPVTVSSSLLEGVCRLQLSDDHHIATLSRLEATESGSDGAHTPDSMEYPTFSPTLPQGYFDDPDNNIEELKPEMCDGKLLPRVSIPSDIWAEAVEQNVWHETFMIPAHMGGVLIGRFGKNVRELRNLWQAEFSLSLCADRQDTLVFKLSCPLENKDSVMHWVNRRFKMRPSKTPIGNPNQLRRYLPLGVPTKVHVRSLYGQKDFFVSIQDTDYDHFLEMQADMDKDYSTITNFRMQLCAPVTSGTVAVLPHNHGFARALILKVFTNSKHALYFLLDYGTFGVVDLCELRKIKAKYMRKRFQAIHVSWAHAWPVFSDVPDLHVLRTFFNSGRTLAQAVRMETCCKASVIFTEPMTETTPACDVLSLACRNGLYLVNSLIIFPNRQCWLNSTNYPYYPPQNSDIDYTALVNFADEPVATQHQQFNNNADKNYHGFHHRRGQPNSFRRSAGTYTKRGCPNNSRAQTQYPKNGAGALSVESSAPQSLGEFVRKRSNKFGLAGNRGGLRGTTGRGGSSHNGKE